jgi:hypothetical protein
MRRTKNLLVLAVVLASVGCTNGEVQLGSTPKKKPAQNSSQIFQGYIENFSFLSGSDDVTIEITATSPTLQGTIYFGDGPDLPPPNDPNVGYPAGLGMDGPPGNWPYEGFHFSIIDGELTQDRLRATMLSSELWTDWCALQTPVPTVITNPPGYNCTADNWSMQPPDTCTADGAPVDCGKLYLCGPSFTCACTSSGCAVTVNGMVSFDLLRDGGGAHGSVQGLSNIGTLNVWLTEE